MTPKEMSSWIREHEYRDVEQMISSTEFQLLLLECPSLQQLGVLQLQLLRTGPLAGKGFWKIRNAIILVLMEIK